MQFFSRSSEKKMGFIPTTHDYEELLAHYRALHSENQDLKNDLVDLRRQLRTSQFLYVPSFDIFKSKSEFNLNTVHQSQPDFVVQTSTSQTQCEIK